MNHTDMMHYHEFVENFSLALAVMTFTIAVSNYIYNHRSVTYLCDKVEKFDKRFNAWDDRYDEWEDYFDDWDERIPHEEDDETSVASTETETDAGTDMDYHTYATEGGDYVHYMKYANNDFMLILPRQEGIRGKCILNVFFRRETRSTRGHVQMTYVDLTGNVNTMTIIRNDTGLHAFLSDLIDE